MHWNQSNWAAIIDKSYNELATHRIPVGHRRSKSSKTYSRSIEKIQARCNLTCICVHNGVSMKCFTHFTTYTWFKYPLNVSYHMSNLLLIVHFGFAVFVEQFCPLNIDNRVSYMHSISSIRYLFFQYNSVYSLATRFSETYQRTCKRVCAVYTVPRRHWAILTHERHFCMIAIIIIIH